MALSRKESERRSKEVVLASLYDEYFDRIACYIYARMGDRAESEDLAGEVFLKALESLDSFEERGKPMQAWLFKIAHNLLVDRYRKMARRKTVSLDNVQVVADCDPHEEAETNIERARVNRALEKLTAMQRKVIEMRFFGELTSEEVAQVLNKRAGAVREMQSAAMKRLREVLSEGV